MWYLLGEVAVLLLLALILGVAIGWLLWGQRRPSGPPKTPKLKKVGGPDKSFLDLNEVDKSNIDLTPGPKQPEVGMMGKRVDFGRSGGLQGQS